MGEEQKQKLAGVLDFLAQTASVVTIPALLGLAYWVHLEIKSALQASQIEAAQAYVQKSEFKDVISQLVTADTKNSYEIKNVRDEEQHNHVDTVLSIQHLNDLANRQKQPN